MFGDRDYSTRLIALSTASLNVDEARALISRDIDQDFLFLEGPSGEMEHFEETASLRLETFFGESPSDHVLKTCTSIRIDFLNPSSRYLDLLANGIRFHALNACCHLEQAMTQLEIEPCWWTIACTTGCDHFMSFYRRTIIILNHDCDGNEFGTGAVRGSLFNPATFDQLEDLMEQSLRKEIEQWRFG